MRITVDEITRIMRLYLMRPDAVRRAMHMAERESEAGGLERLRQVHDRLVNASDPANGEGFPALWRGRLPDGPDQDERNARLRRLWLEQREASYHHVVDQHRTLMERFYGESEPDDVDRVQPSIRDQWEQHERVSPTYAPDRATEANMTTDDILVTIDESLREYDDEAHANEQAQADKIAARKDRRGETAAAGGASPSDILDRIAVPGGNWPTEV